MNWQRTSGAVVDVRETWGQILGKVKTAIAALPGGTQPDLDRKRQFDELATLLHHVKEAWRNPSMHAAQKYTGEEAGAVYAAVRAFVRKVAAVV